MLAYKCYSIQSVSKWYIICHVIQPCILCYRYYVIMSILHLKSNHRYLEHKGIDSKLCSTTDIKWHTT